MLQEYKTNKTYWEWVGSFTFWFQHNWLANWCCSCLKVLFLCCFGVVCLFLLVSPFLLFSSLSLSLLVCLWYVFFCCWLPLPASLLHSHSVQEWGSSRGPSRTTSHFGCGSFWMRRIDWTEERRRDYSCVRCSVKNDDFGQWQYKTRICFAFSWCLALLCFYSALPIFTNLSLQLYFLILLFFRQ